MDESANASTNQAQNCAPNSQHMCPNCGYCSCCGRANARPYLAPYPLPYYPWWGVTYPYGVTGIGPSYCGATTIQNNAGAAPSIGWQASLTAGGALQCPNMIVDIKC